jgi:hypothetical protein
MEPIKEILLSSSIAYLLSPIRSKRLLIKIVWIIFLIVLLFSSFYYVILNILDYLKYDTTTSIYEINELESEFPTISFCLKNNLIFEIDIKEFYFNNIKLIEEWKNHIESYQDPMMGQCYRFNSGLNMSNQSIPIKKSKTSGLFDGFWFKVNSKSNDSKPDSLFITITNHTQNYMHSSQGYNYYASFNYNNYYIIERVFSQKLELPFNNCFKDLSQLTSPNRTIIDYLNTFNRSYSQRECLNSCRNLKFNEFNYCSCQLTSLFDEIWTSCYDSVWQTSCYNEFIDNFSFASCLAYCPLECDSLSYDITSYMEAINDENDTSYINYNIYVYYQDLKYTLISEQPKVELFGLISNLGGILGLFISFSFISLLELFELIAEFIYILFD